MATMRTIAVTILSSVSVLAGCGEAPAVKTYLTDKPASFVAAPTLGPGEVLLESLVYTPPADWSAQGAGNMVMAQYQTPDGLRMTVSRAMGDLTGNINRWRGQLGLAPLTQPVDPAKLEQVDSPAGRVLLVDLVAEAEVPAGPVAPTASEARRFRIGLLADRQGGSLTGQTWFFKFDGPADAVEQRRGRFDAMLGTLRWADGAVVSQ